MRAATPLERAAGSLYAAAVRARDAGLTRAPERRWRAVQDRRVREAARHAFRSVPFYRSWLRGQGGGPEDFRSADDLARLPLIGKSEYRKDPKAFCSEARGFGAGLEVPTSGTTGQPALFHHDRRALLLNIAYGERERSVISALLGVGGPYRELVFRRPGSSFLDVQRYYDRTLFRPRRLTGNRAVVLTGESFEDALAALRSFRPDVLSAFGSYLGALFRHAHRHGIPIAAPRVASYCGDAPADADRELIANRFGTRLVSTYRTAECLKIGFSCDAGDGFHIHPDLCAVRLVDRAGGPVSPGEPGEVVLSNLLTRSTVLLNYRIGDLAVEETGPCPCGRTFPRIRLLETRPMELVELPDGRILDPYRITETITARPEVDRYQIVQCGPAEFLVRAVIRPECDAGESCRVATRALETAIEGCRFRVVPAPELPDAASGAKFRLFSPLRGTR